MSFWVGMDVGKEQDRTALAVVERASVDEGWDPVTWARKERHEMRVRQVETLPLGTGYAAMVEHAAGRVRRLAARGPVTLVVDATGAGAPVAEMLRRESGLRVRAMVITGDGKAREVNGGYHVSRAELLSRLAVALERGTVGFSRKMSEARAFEEELRGLRVRDGRVVTAGNGHDDRVMAVAMALWAAERGAISVWGKARLV